MPVKWTAELEREMLLRAISGADLRPTMTTWEHVAEKLGQGLNANAVSQKFNKLKRELDGMENDTAPNPPATPKNMNSKKTTTSTAKSTGGATKRKTKGDGDATPSKRSKSAAQNLPGFKDEDAENIKIKPEMKEEPN